MKAKVELKDEPVKLPVLSDKRAAIILEGNQSRIFHFQNLPGFLGWYVVIIKAGSLVAMPEEGNPLQSIRHQIISDEFKVLQGKAPHYTAEEIKDLLEAHQKANTVEIYVAGYEHATTDKSDYFVKGKITALSKEEIVIQRDYKTGGGTIEVHESSVIKVDNILFLKVV